MNQYVIIVLMFLGILVVTHDNSKANTSDIAEIKQLDKEQLKKSIVKITSQGHQGTGFVVGVIQDTTYILTISHVVGSNREPNIEFFGQPGEFKAKVLEIEWQQKMDWREENGFALLAVTGAPSDVISLDVDKKSDLKSGDSVFTFGFPLNGGNWAYDEWSYSSRIARKILFSGSDIKEGNSGSPLIKGNEVVGMVTSVTDFAHANSAESIREFLRGISIGEVILDNLERRLYEYNLPEGMIIAYAANSGGYATEHDGHGVYTKYLLKEMQQIQPIEQIFRKVSKAVKQHTQSQEIQQIPGFTTSLSGDFCLGGCLQTEPNNAVKQLALVIGNGHYTYRPSLFGSINDAQSIANILREKKFEVILETNVNFIDMKKYIQEFITRLSLENGVGLFYFSGDGFQIDGKDYIVPIDYKPLGTSSNSTNMYGLENKYFLHVGVTGIIVEPTTPKLVSVDSISEQMMSANKKVNIIILDSCRNELFEPKGR